MQPHVLRLLESSGVQLVCKSDSWLMRLIGALLFWNDAFMTSFWTTITLPGFRRIYYPAGVNAIVARNSTPVLWHEWQHVKQADGPTKWLRWPWNLAFHFLYLMAFFPVGLAYFRMRWEVDAYAVGYRARVTSNALKGYRLDIYAQWVADSLWSAYAWAWPRAWTKARFLRRVAALQQSREIP